MKLIFAIIHETDSEDVVETLITSGYSVTRMASSGGFLRYGNITLLIGVEPDQVDDVFTVLKEHCSPIAPNQHAATIWVLDMPVFKKL
jgi:uncharacterized protein YaaQ